MSVENQIKVLIVDFIGANITKIKAALSKMSGTTYEISWTQVGENILNKVEGEKLPSFHVSSRYQYFSHLIEHMKGKCFFVTFLDGTF